MTTRRAVLGVGGGLITWAIGAFAFPSRPSAVAFYITAVALVLGCGALPLRRLLRHSPIEEAVVVALAFGTALAPALMHILALLRLSVLVPPIAFAATGAAVACLIGGGARASARRGDRWAFVLLPAAVFLVTAWVSSGRVRSTGTSLALFGNYDTLDLAYYASITAELNQTHLLPPPSPFYAGHYIVHSYFPLTLLGEVQKFSGARLTETFLVLGWPFYCAVLAAALLALYRRLGSLTFAVLSTVLTFTGSTLAYLFAWRWPHMVAFDPVVWSSLFLAPSSEWLFFNAWTPALIVLSAGLYALDRMHEEGGRGWAVVAALCFGHFFMFKSFAYPVVVAALGVTAAIALIRKSPHRWRLVGVTVGAVGFAAPWILAVLPYNGLENRGALISVEYLSLVRRMLFKGNLIDTIANFVHQFVSPDPTARITLALATLLFLVGGLGTRCLALAPLIRAALGAGERARWTPLAWMSILGAAVPFIISFAPFPNAIQPYMIALFLLWPFAVTVIWPPDARPTIARGLATAVIVAMSVPATLHYARAAHDAPSSPPIVSADEGDFRIIRALARTDPDTTLVVHSDPLWPSLYAIESGRRVLLAVYSYVMGDGNPDVDARVAEIERFFGAHERQGADDLGLLAKYRVTHVIERVPVDRLHPNVVKQLHLVTGTEKVRLYEVTAQSRAFSPKTSAFPAQSR